MPLEKSISLSNPKTSLWWARLLATRPKTFTMSLIPFVVGTLLARANGASISWMLMLFAILSSIAIQIGTHFVNDALDYRRGVDKKGRLGPIRLIQTGLQTSQQVYQWGLLAYLLAFLLGIPLMIEGGTPLLWILLVSILCGYCYTGGPYPLSSSGLSELFVLIFYGWVATGSIYYLQGERLDSQIILMGTQIGLLANITLAINNFRDYSSDRSANKRTLVVRLGQTFGRYQIALFAFLPFALNLFWWQSHFLAALLPFLVLPLALYIVYFIFKYEPSPQYSRVFGLSALLHLSFGLLLSLGLVL
jgi:1,4-dihydroxy-2-naphthoate octaprenyltransferase